MNFHWLLLWQKIRLLQTTFVYVAVDVVVKFGVCDRVDNSYASGLAIATRTEITQTRSDKPVSNFTSNAVKDVFVYGFFIK
ncbi:hypothetical protein [Floridanema evergladense]|uniref:Secreted protein n=1 Tax=Floridaenema evergladense BLCC-F167 TaxID=3153639 RepID=A0ABV4WN02_9CYAN